MILISEGKYENYETQIFGLIWHYSNYINRCDIIQVNTFQSHSIKNDADIELTPVTTALLTTLLLFLHSFTEFRNCHN